MSQHAKEVISLEGRMKRHIQYVCPVCTQLVLYIHCRGGERGRERGREGGREGVRERREGDKREKQGRRDGGEILVVSMKQLYTCTCTVP